MKKTIAILLAVMTLFRFFTESCGIDRNEVDKRSKEDF